MTDSELKEMHAACTNWARWSRSGSGGPARCGSIESRYLPEKLTDEIAKEKNAKQPEPVNHRDAERVEAAVCRMLQTGRFLEHRVIKLMYLDGQSIKELAARFSSGELETTNLWRHSLDLLRQAIQRRDAVDRAITGGNREWLAKVTTSSGI